MTPLEIHEIYVVTQAGVSCRRVGKTVNDRRIVSIKKAPLYFNGDPFDHYCCYDEKGEIIVSINCLAPCEVTYK